MKQPLLKPLTGGILPFFLPSGQKLATLQPALEEAYLLGNKTIRRSEYALAELLRQEMSPKAIESGRLNPNLSETQ